jgi:valyl-tRNA synthetase
MHVIQGATLDELHATLLTGNVDAREIDDARKSQREDYPQVCACSRSHSM